MALTRISIAKPDILSYFDSLSDRIFTYKTLRLAFAENRTFWRLAQSFRFTEFVEFLQTEGKLKETRFEFPSITEIRYTWGQVPDMNLILSIRPNSFFSHYTAVAHHHLTDQIPKVIYLNKEQGSPKGRDSNLVQTGIDRAFSSAPRKANRIAHYNDLRICLLESMGLEGEGIAELTDDSGNTLRITDLERTLIDITVRPFYAGGVFEVLQAYIRAHDRVSVNRMVALLAKYKFIYPFHQAIGFYLERSGLYRPSQINLLKSLPMKHDFYLTYQIKNKKYSKDWRLFYPDGL